MPRARNIKPGLFMDDELAEVEPLGRLLFIGLWTIADFRGNFVWRPKKVKSQLLPYDDCDISALAIYLEQYGFIRFYSDRKNIYCNVVTFSTHQNPHKNEKDKGSDIPEYSESMAQAVDLTTLTIKTDKIASEPDNVRRDPADSCFLIPDSCSLIPDSCSPTPDSLTPDSQPIKRKKTKAKNGTKAEDPNKVARREIWQSYSAAFFSRYTTEPVSNAKTNSNIKQIHERLGADAKHVAEFFVSINDQWLIKRSHSVGDLLANCESYRTQWATGQAITTTGARQTEQAQNNMDVAGQANALRRTKNVN